MTEVNQNDDIMNELQAEFGDDGLLEVGAREGGFNYPAGGYDFKGINAYLNRSKTSQRKQVTLVCEIIGCDVEGADMIGKKFHKQWGLQTTENITWLNGDLVNLELEIIKKPSDLSRVCTDLVGICFHGTLVENKDSNFGPNMYINRGARQRQLEGGAAPAASTPGQF